MPTLPDRPLIEYPCEWEYRIIGSDLDQIRAAVLEIMGSEEGYSLTPANRSREGRWLSMSLTLVVPSEERRDAIHKALQEHRSIRFVL